MDNESKQVIKQSVVRAFSQLFDERFDSMCSPAKQAHELGDTSGCAQVKFRLSGSFSPSDGHQTIMLHLSQRTASSSGREIEIDTKQPELPGVSISKTCQMK